MRNWLRVGGVLLILATLTLAARSHPDARPSARRTRIGLLNLSYVVKNYEKFKAYEEDLKKRLKPYQERDEENKKKLAALTSELESPDTTADRRAAIEKKQKAFSARCRTTPPRSRNS